MIGSASLVAMLTLVGLIFAQALIHKLRNPRRFTQAVREYDLFPGTLALPASLFLALAELSVVVLILISILFPNLLDSLIARSGLAAAAVLLALYGAAMGINLAREKFGLDCGCTSGATPISIVLVLRNIALSVFALTAAVIPSTASGDRTLGIPAGIALFLGYLTMTQLSANRVRGSISNRNQ